MRELRTICGTRGILPTSYTLPPDLLSIDLDPFARGGYGDVYRGTLDGSMVCVKRMQVYTGDDPRRAAKVRINAVASPALSITKSADLLPRGRNVETLDTPKYLTPAWCYYQPLSTHFNLDVRRSSAGLRPGQR